MCRLWKGRLLSTTTEQKRNDAAGPNLLLDQVDAPEAQTSLRAGQQEQTSFVCANKFSNISIEDGVDVCVTGQSESSRLCLDRRLLCYQNSVLRHVSSRRPTSFALEHIPPRLAALQHFTTNVNLSSDTSSHLSEWSVMCTRHSSLYIFEDVFFYFLNKLFFAFDRSLLAGLWRL